MRPTILLPVSAVTGLSQEELEMILVHELAHMRRFDMWINFLQRVAEILFFFNPLGLSPPKTMPADSGASGAAFIGTSAIPTENPRIWILFQPLKSEGLRYH